MIDAKNVKWPSDWSHDGKWILYTQFERGNQGIWALPATGERKPVPLIPPQYFTNAARFSPDSRYFAYHSGEYGRAELYVQTFSPGAPGSGGKWQISTQGVDQDRGHSGGAMQPDGQRFLVSVPLVSQAQEPIHVILNWTATLPEHKK